MIRIRFLTIICVVLFTFTSWAKDPYAPFRGADKRTIYPEQFTIPEYTLNLTQEETFMSVSLIGEAPEEDYVGSSREISRYVKKVLRKYSQGDIERALDIITKLVKEGETEKAGKVLNEIFYLDSDAFEGIVENLKVTAPLETLKIFLSLEDLGWDINVSEYADLVDAVNDPEVVAGILAEIDAELAADILIELSSRGKTAEVIDILKSIDAMDAEAAGVILKVISQKDPDLYLEYHGVPSISSIVSANDLVYTGNLIDELYSSGKGEVAVVLLRELSVRGYSELAAEALFSEYESSPDILADVLDMVVVEGNIDVVLQILNIITEINPGGNTALYIEMETLTIEQKIEGIVNDILAFTSQQDDPEVTGNILETLFISDGQNDLLTGVIVDLVEKGHLDLVSDSLLTWDFKAARDALDIVAGTNVEAALEVLYSMKNIHPYDDNPQELGDLMWILFFNSQNNLLSGFIVDLVENGNVDLIADSLLSWDIELAADLLDIVAESNVGAALEILDSVTEKAQDDFVLQNILWVLFSNKHNSDLLGGFVINLVESGYMGLITDSLVSWSNPESAARFLDIVAESNVDTALSILDSITDASPGESAGIYVEMKNLTNDQKVDGIAKDIVAVVNQGEDLELAANILFSLFQNGQNDLLAGVVVNLVENGNESIVTDRLLSMDYVIRARILDIVAESNVDTALSILNSITDASPGESASICVEMKNLTNDQKVDGIAKDIVAVVNQGEDFELAANILFSLFHNGQNDLLTGVVVNLAESGNESILGDFFMHIGVASSARILGLTLAVDEEAVNKVLNYIESQDSELSELIRNELRLI